MIKNLAKAWKMDVLLLLLGLEILAAGYLFDIKKLKQKLNMTNSDLVFAKTKVVDLNLTSDKSAKKGKDDFVKAKINLMGVIEELEFLASKSQIRHFLFEPLLAKSEDGFGGVQVQLEIAGDQEQLDLFLKGVLSSFVLRIRNFSLERDKQKDGGLMMRLIMIFYEVEYKASKEQFYKIADELLFKVNRDVFNEHHSMGDLYWWEVDDFCLIGTIKRKNTLIGMIGDPHGGVHQVKVGDQVGRDKTKVIGVAKDAVRLSGDKKIVCIKKCD